MVTEECTRVDGPSDDPAQRVPCSVVKPVMEAVEAFLCQELGCSEVEVGVKLVDHALEAQHGEQSRGERWEERGGEGTLLLQLRVPAKALTENGGCGEGQKLQ